MEALLERAYRAGAEKQESESRNRNLYFSQLMNLLPDFVYFKDLESRFLSVNPAHARHLGLKNPAEAVGKSDFDFFKEEYARAKYEDEQEIIRTGVGFLFREEHHFLQSGEEHWSLSTKLPLFDESGAIRGTFGLSRNITDKKRAEMELENQKSLLETIVEILPCRVFVRDRDGHYLLINKEYRKWIEVSADTAVIGKKIEDFLDEEKINRVSAEDAEIVRTGRSIINQVRFDENPMKRERWILTSKVPLKNSSQKIQGLVGMTLDITEQKEAEHRAQVAQSALLEKNQQMEAELLVARQLQERLLSEGFAEDRTLRRRGRHWTVAAHYLYEPSHHLAGDFFFLLPVDENRIGIIICDVMGHGVKAALVTTLIRGLLLEIPEILDEPGAVLRFLNGKLHGLAEKSYFPRFVTASYAVIDSDRGRVCAANAGHPFPVFRQGEEMTARTFPFSDPGSALGLQRESLYHETEISLRERTQLHFYTDGIVEFENPQGAEFGMDRFMDSIARAGAKSPDQINRMIADDIRNFGQGREQTDDVCLISLEVVPSPVPTGD